ncbi:MAG: hypothetical protein KC441_14300 [Anaerolineales bacterium]|nr:hypothetical protein [Anaerolineales bacterium]
MKKYFFALFIILLAACSSPEPETITVKETVIAQVPVTVEVTREVTVEKPVEVVQEVEVTRVVEVTRMMTVEKPVTVTPTNTPVNSPTPSSTPTITPTPSNTPTSTPSSTPTATPDLAQTATIQAYGVLAAPKGSGFFTVGTEILPGKWRSTGSGTGCYWARLDTNQDPIDNHFGLAGGTVNIQPSDYEVEFNDCGTWEYVENETPVLLETAVDPKGDGFYTVGVEIAAGRWESTGTSDDCYWARLDGRQNVLNNHFGNAGGSINIAPSDYEVQFDGCGMWEYVGP